MEYAIRNMFLNYINNLNKLLTQTKFKEHEEGKIKSNQQK